MTSNLDDRRLRMLADLYRNAVKYVRLEPTWRRKLLVTLVLAILPSVYVFMCSVACGLTGLMLLVLFATSATTAEVESFGIRSLGTGFVLGVFTFLMFVLDTKGPGHAPRAQQDW